MRGPTSLALHEVSGHNAFEGNSHSHSDCKDSNYKTSRSLCCCFPSQRMDHNCTAKWAQCTKSKDRHYENKLKLAQREIHYAWRSLFAKEASKISVLQ